MCDEIAEPNGNPLTGEEAVPEIIGGALEEGPDGPQSYRPRGHRERLAPNLAEYLAVANMGNHILSSLSVSVGCWNRCPLTSVKEAVVSHMQRVFREE